MSSIVTVTEEDGSVRPLEFPKHLEAEFDRTSKIIEKNAYKLYWFVEKEARFGNEIARGIMDQMDMGEYYLPLEQFKKVRASRNEQS